MTSGGLPKKRPEPAKSAAFRRAKLLHPRAMSEVATELDMAVEDEHQLLELMTRTARLAVRVVQGIDHAGITAGFDTEPFSVAPTDESVLIVDRSQYADNDGPCLRAMRTERVISMDITQVQNIWPALAVAARGAGVQRFLASPLHSGVESIGSLNLYGDNSESATNQHPDTMTVLVDYLDRGLTDYGTYRSRGLQARALRDAIRARAQIDQAVGILMARQGIDDDRARRELDSYANIIGATRVDAAARLVAEHADASQSDPGTP